MYLVDVSFMRSDIDTVEIVDAADEAQAEFEALEYVRDMYDDVYNPVVLAVREG